MKKSEPAKIELHPDAWTRVLIVWLSLSSHDSFKIDVGPKFQPLTWVVGFNIALTVVFMGKLFLK
jgi:hypothetical protein